MNTEWRDIWQYKEYHLWERKLDGEVYIYNMTKDSNPPGNMAGYYGAYAVLTLKGIPIHNPKIRAEIEVATKNQ